MSARPVRMCSTRYAGPTDMRGSRVIATHVTTRERVTVPWDHALDPGANHAVAAARVLGREPEFMASIDGGGYLFGVDPAPSDADDYEQRWLAECRAHGETRRKLEAAVRELNCSCRPGDDSPCPACREVSQ